MDLSFPICGGKNHNMNILNRWKRRHLDVYKHECKIWVGDLISFPLSQLDNHQLDIHSYLQNFVLVNPNFYLTCTLLLISHKKWFKHNNTNYYIDQYFLNLEVINTYYKRLEYLYKLSIPCATWDYNLHRW